MFGVRRWQLSLLTVFVIVSMVCILLAGYSRQLKYRRTVREARQAVADCPGAWGMGEPRKAIRAVNLLLALKKSDCVDVLREFAHRHHESVLPLLIPVIFPTDCQEVLPPEEVFDHARKKWIFEYSETYVAGDIPFDIFGSYGVSGPDSYYFDKVLDWCRHSGVRREHPLRPIDNPFEAVESVDTSFALTRDEEERMILLCRWQAWSLAPDVKVEGLWFGVQSCPRLTDSAPAPEFLLDPAVWEQLLTKGNQFRWCSDRSCYGKN